MGNGQDQAQGVGEAGGAVLDNPGDAGLSPTRAQVVQPLCGAVHVLHKCMW